MAIRHHLIVPLSIGLTGLVATMQTLAYRRRGTDAGTVWDRSAKFWSQIMLVLFALGIVTGVVQEFQFGMNWSTYSRWSCKAHRLRCRNGCSQRHHCDGR